MTIRMVGDNPNGFDTRMRDSVLGLWSYMAKKHGVTVRHKHDSTFMANVGRLLQRLSIMSYNQFMSGFVTTIGKTIYLPFDLGDTERWSYWDQIILCAHEFQHVIQYEREGMSFFLGYLFSSSKRARFECEAFRSLLEMEFWRWQSLLITMKYIALKLRYYGCKDVDVIATEAYLRACLPTIEAGGVRNQASKEVIAWLRANHPFWEMH